MTTQSSSNLGFGSSSVIGIPAAAKAAPTGLGMTSCAWRFRFFVRLSCHIGWHPGPRKDHHVGSLPRLRGTAALSMAMGLGGCFDKLTVRPHKNRQQTTRCWVTSRLLRRPHATGALGMVMVNAGFVWGWCVGELPAAWAPELQMVRGVKVASGPGGLGGPGRALRGRRGGTLMFFAAREAQAASGSALRLSSSLELRLYALCFSFKSVYRVWGSWFRVQDSASKVSG